MNTTLATAAAREPSTLALARFGPGVLGALGIALLFFIWWLATDVASAPGSFLGRFSLLKTSQALSQLVFDPSFGIHVAVSLKRIAVGLGLAALFGLPIGICVGLSRKLEAATTPAFQFLRMISPWLYSQA